MHSSFSSGPCSSVLNPTDTRKVLQSLTCVTNDEVRRFVLLALYESLTLDPIPASLVKDCIDILIALYRYSSNTDNINVSMYQCINVSMYG